MQCIGTGPSEFEEALRPCRSDPLSAELHFGVTPNSYLFAAGALLRFEDAANGCGLIFLKRSRGELHPCNFLAEKIDLSPRCGFSTFQRKRRRSVNNRCDPLVAVWHDGTAGWA